MDENNILFPNGKCIICDCYVNPIEYVDLEYNLYNCKNGCCFYRLYYFNNQIDFEGNSIISKVHYYSIFGTTFSFSSDNTDEDREDAINKIRKRVSYWKENDRYLAAILGRD